MSIHYTRLSARGLEELAMRDLWLSRIPGILQLNRQRIRYTNTACR